MEERGRDEKRRGGERMPGGGRRGGMTPLAQTIHR